VCCGHVADACCLALRLPGFWDYGGFVGAAKFFPSFNGGQAYLLKTVFLPGTGFTVVALSIDVVPSCALFILFGGTTGAYFRAVHYLPC